MRTGVRALLNSQCRQSEQRARAGNVDLFASIFAITLMSLGLIAFIVAVAGILGFIPPPPRWSGHRRRTGDRV